MTTPSLPARRPAETGTLVAGAIALVLGRAFGWDGDVQGAVGVIVAALPAAISWSIDRVRRPPVVA